MGYAIGRVRRSLSVAPRALCRPVTAKVDEGNGRERVLTEGEIAKAWAACGDDDFGKIVKLLLLTGQRRNEIGGLRWSEVNLADGTIAFAEERVKNGRQHTLPLSRQAVAILAELPRNGGEAVFRRAIGQELKRG